jgi:hypothetical protein
MIRSRAFLPALALLFAGPAALVLSRRSGELSQQSCAATLLLLT